MHWLTWRQLADFLKSWEGLAVAFLGAAAAVYYAPRKVLETWDWYVDRFLDSPVLNILRDRRLIHRPVMNNWSPAPPPEEVEYGLPEIAEKLSRSRESVGKSLQRLRKQGKAELYRGGWRLGVRDRQH